MQLLWMLLWDSDSHDEIGEKGTCYKLFLDRKVGQQEVQGLR
jgi:hypothetical protein